MRVIVVFSLQSSRTVLHYAAQLGSQDVVELLLENKIDADAVDKVNNIRASATVNANQELCLWQWSN